MQLPTYIVFPQNTLPSLLPIVIQALGSGDSEVALDTLFRHYMDTLSLGSDVGFQLDYAADRLGEYLEYYWGDIGIPDDAFQSVLQYTLFFKECLDPQVSALRQLLTYHPDLAVNNVHYRKVAGSYLLFLEYFDCHTGELQSDLHPPRPERFKPHGEGPRLPTLVEDYHTFGAPQSVDPKVYPPR